MRIIGGKSKGRKLKEVHRTATRPTMDRVRESLFAILAPWIEGARFLDLFAGTGSVGLEALSRGGKEVVFVDINRACASVIRENADLLGRSADAQVIPRRWESAIHQLAAEGQCFDIVFADPPYEQEGVLKKVAEQILGLGLIAPGGWIIFEHSVRLQSPAIWPGNPQTDARRFGDTMLTLLRIADSEAAPHLHHRFPREL